MKEIKEVSVFTNGDSRKISTWSNIPFFFTETLISKGIKVNRIDISPSPFFEKIYRRIFLRILKIIYINTTYTFFRSYVNYLHQKCRIRKTVKKYKNADVNIFLTFSFSSAGLTKKPTVLFSDWTYDHYFNNFLNRMPDIFEKSSIKREDRQIESSNLIFPLFPNVVDYMKKRYKNKNIFYIGNVINSLVDATEAQILAKKSNSHDLLFIGSRQYILGAKYLIKAFDVLKYEYPNLSLHIIGMRENDFDYLPDRVNCYGYLDKGKDSEKELYYSLLQKAKVFVNTTPGWGAFSASIEAMYFYVPVIVTPYNGFLKTFGENINFGYYCNNSIELLCLNIKKIFNNDSYETLCINSHKAIRDFTWNSYIDKMLNIMKEKL